MTDTTLASVMLFGYMSLALLVAIFFRNQFKFLQKLFLPAAVLAGFIILITGPSMLGIYNVPMGKHIDAYVFHLITAIFIILGLRGYSSERNVPRTGTTTLFIAKVFSFQAALGILLTMLIAISIQPGLFSGFGSFLMLGFGFDPTVSLYFGGFWEEELGFSNGRHIAFSFAVLGFLVAYILGLLMIGIAKKRGEVSIYPRNEDSPVLSGIVDKDSQGISAGRLTTTSQAMESLTLHLAVIGIVFLLSYSFMRLIARWMVSEFDAGFVIVAEVFMNFQFFFGFIFALLVKRIIRYFSVEHILDEGLMNRSLGVASDYLVVAAIASIPLVISSIRLWETLTLVLVGAVATYFFVIFLSRLLYKEEDCIERRAALFGFVTGNISTSVALLRVVDPELRHPVGRDLAFAGVLTFFAAIPLIFIINLPLIAEETMYQLYAALISIGYIVVLYVIWTLFGIRKSRREKKEQE